MTQNDNWVILNVPLNKLEKLSNIGTKLSDFETIEKDGKPYWLLGKGNFGYAEKMKSKLDNKIYAIKKLDTYSPNFNERDFLRETENMINLNHENIIKLYGYFSDKENINKFKEIYSNNPSIQKEKNDKEILCLVMEFAQNGSLEDYYWNHESQYPDKNNFVPIPQNFIVKILKQLLSALTYLGSKSIMHRDIKPDNLLLDENNNVKISDFGISALYYDANPENENKDTALFSSFTAVGRQDFIAPEIEKNEQYDFRIDIYSLGLTMLCLMSKQYPIQFIKDPNVQQIVRNVNIGKMDKSYSIYLRALVLKMLSYKIDRRPYANQAYYELENIEKYINNPNDKQIKDYLDENYGKLMNLENIGIKLSDFEAIPTKNKKYSLLGKGNFVYAEKMKSKIDNKIYAIKKIDKNNKEFKSKDFLRETEIMINLQNENIVKLYGFFEDRENIRKLKDIYKENKNIQKETNDKEIYCLVLEFIPNGSLEQYNLNNKKPFPQDFIIKIFKQILNALKYLHSKKIMHRDIKLDNILLDKNNNAKLSDFGISALYDDNNSQNQNQNSKAQLISNFTTVGSRDFISPEIERGERYDFRTDIYSLGLTMLCLMSSQRIEQLIQCLRDVQTNENVK